MKKFLFRYKVALQWVWIRFFLKIPSKHIRRFFLNLYKDVQIHNSVPIYSGLKWWSGPLEINEGASIGFNAHLDCRCGITIGRNVCIASNVCVWTLHHDYNDINFNTRGGHVYIGDYAWLCSHCIVLPGIKIGEGAIVASGAVVCKDVKPWTVVGGIPAREINKREQKKYQYSPGNYWIPFV